MAGYTDLEIGLYYRDADSYTVELRFRDPDAQTDEAPCRGQARFDFAALKAAQDDPQIYGQCLTAGLFANEEVRKGFEAARIRSQEREKTLRLRLYIHHEVPELHGLRWETLRDSRGDGWLVTGERILLSRFLRSSDSGPVKLRPKGDLRALVFIANPTNLDEYRNLAPVQVQAERDRARAGLGRLIAHEIYSQENVAGRATLNNLVAALRDAVARHESYDILYIVCHGVLRKKDRRDDQSPEEPFLLLEREDGTADLARGIDLVSQLRGLQQQPWLVVLASCQSAGHGDAMPAGEQLHKPRVGDERGALAALGPRLADAGVPAVLAMQGSIMMETVSLFMPEFFKQLSTHGQIDRAVGIARSAVLRTQRDWWMPALFMRLREGRIWYEPGFRPGTFEKWPTLLQNIRGETDLDKCTPILGSGLLDPLLGSSRELARSWAETYRFPMAPTSQEDLPQVAQYLTVNQDELFPYKQFRSYLCEKIKQRYRDQLPAELREASADQLDQLLEVAAAQLWQQNPDDPYLVLARLPFKLYITTNPDNLLAVALAKVGKEPRVEVCPWNDELMQSQVEAESPEKRAWLLSAKKPLVYHLFGQLSNPDSLVLTEDNYFDYLIGVTRNNDIVPRSVGRAEADSMLMFLGFQLDDWNFRVLLRSLLRHRGGRRGRYQHVAVQIVPEEGRLLETERARQYLEKYFGKENIKISIYWGSSEEFIRELRVEWNKLYGDKMPI